MGIFMTEEKELLIDAAKHGEFYLISTNQIGTWVRVGDKDFLDVSDPAVAAKYLDALESLCKDGHIKQETPVYYKLTGSGFTLARELAEEN